MDRNSGRNDYQDDRKNKKIEKQGESGRAGRLAESTMQYYRQVMQAIDENSHDEEEMSK